LLITGTFIAELCANAVDIANGRFTDGQNRSYAGVREIDVEMLVVTGEGVPSFKGIAIGDLPINSLEFVRKGALILARLLAEAMSVSAVDVAMGLADGLPSALYTGAGIERYLCDALSEWGPSVGLSELLDEL
jgi:hypothetical protein